MNTWLRRGFIATLLGVASLAVHVPTASAQIAAAIGKPLPSPDLPVGTVSVRVIAGTVASPIAGTEVTLVVNGTPRVARTDEAGRATFTNLPAGAKLQAKVHDDDEDKKEFASDEFDLSDSSGQRLMLSTKPFQPPGGGGAPFAGGGGGMPDPRLISGAAPARGPGPAGLVHGAAHVRRPDRQDARRSNLPVFLVGYQADDKVVVYEAMSDAARPRDVQGARSDRRDLVLRDGAAARGSGVDRLVSTPAVLDSRAGVRLILSAEKRGSTAPAVDDLTQIEKQDGAPEAGKVRIVLEGVPEDNAAVSLVAMKPDGTRRVIARSVPTRAAPDPQGRSRASRSSRPSPTSRPTGYASRSTAVPTATSRSAACRSGWCRPRR